jgi:hypothetical protein
MTRKGGAFSSGSPESGLTTIISVFQYSLNQNGTEISRLKNATVQSRRHQVMEDPAGPLNRGVGVVVWASWCGRRGVGVVVWASGNHLVKDPARDIGQAKIASRVGEGEPFVIKPHQVEDGRVQVMHVDRIFDGPHAKLVGGAVGHATPDATTGQPGGEP